MIKNGRVFKSDR